VPKLPESWMNSVVLDASAVLAVLHKEPGADRVLARIKGAVISAVNFAEVVTRLSRSAVTPNRQRAKRKVIRGMNDRERLQIATYQLWDRFVVT
jgi:PIN domain nuclease of toxin-antitoxin system